MNELWSESLAILRKVMAGCPKSAASAKFVLCRLPLALQCLYNLIKLSDSDQFSHAELNGWQQRLKILFMPVYRIITAVPDREKLPLIQTSLCLLLKLGSLLQFALQDKDQFALGYPRRKLMSRNAGKMKLLPESKLFNTEGS